MHTIMATVETREYEKDSFHTLRRILPHAPDCMRSQIPHVARFLHCQEVAPIAD